MTGRRTIGLVLVSGALLVGTGCANNPRPELTPDAQLASQDGQVVNALDLARDGTLIFHNDLGTSQLSTPIARRLVQTHESALKLLQVRSKGYVEIIQASLEEVIKQFSPTLNRRVAPYFSLASTLLGLLSNRAIDEQLSAEVIAAYKASLADSLAFDAAWMGRH